MYFIFLIVVILTAIALVVAAMTIAKLIAPRSFNPQFPWAVVVAETGVYALCGAAFFLGILILGLAYAWRKGALEWK